MSTKFMMTTSPYPAAYKYMMYIGWYLPAPAENEHYLTVLQASAALIS